MILNRDIEEKDGNLLTDGEKTYLGFKSQFSSSMTLLYSVLLFYRMFCAGCRIISMALIFYVKVMHFVNIA